jgi:LytS/YehU family sensor histidine kinase
VLLGERKSEAPYFSEDIALLGSLADVLSSVLENVRLQKREREQQRLTQELSLHASRSELRALRAQINPHFLFNALNAIAGLIHRDPEIADRTIEKLADVFRYTLRVSEREWAVVDDEIEFVRAYLDVEQARFGERLSAEVRLHDSARGARVPTMTVQTLVENAIKHGAAAVRGQARIVVSAQRDGDRLRLTVEDNGPGVEAAETLHADDVRRTGYGLKNIRRRLEGHFGTAAAFSIGHDDTRHMTVAMVTLPFLSDEPRSTVAVSAGEVRP